MPVKSIDISNAVNYPPITNGNSAAANGGKNFFYRFVFDAGKTHFSSREISHFRCFDVSFWPWIKTLKAFERF